MNFSEMPVEIWADLLEEEGEDTTELREWIASGLKVSESDFYCSHDHSSGYCYDNGRGFGDGSGYNSTGTGGIGNGLCHNYSIGSAYDSGAGSGDNNHYGDGDRWGSDDSAEDE